MIGKGFGSRRIVRIGGRRAQLISMRRVKARQVLRVVVPGVEAGRQRVVVRRGSQIVRRRFVVLAPFSGAVGVTLERRRAKSAEIGRDGGTVTAGHDGVRYTLTVPGGALSGDEKITMTPIRRMTGLPLTGGRPAAVHFAPEGLRFESPASLLIEFPKRAKRLLAGFTTTGTGKNFELQQLHGTRSRVTVPIKHFSTGGAAPVNQADFVLQAQPLLDGVSQGELTEGQIATLAGVYANWVHIFGTGFCDTQPLCQQAVQIMRTNLERLTTDYCMRGRTDPTRAWVAKLLRLEQLSQELAFSEGAALQCATAIHRSLVDAAVVAAKLNPFAQSQVDEVLVGSSQGDLDADWVISNLEWAWLLVPQAQDLDIDTGQVVLAAESAMALARADGLNLCDSNEPAGRALLERRLSLNISLGLSEHQLVEALELCGLTVTVSPATLTLEVGQFHQFSADTPVTWSATNGTVASNGGYTAPDTPGTYIVRGTSTRRESRFDTATVTVVPPIEVAISPTVTSLAYGATRQFTATLTGTSDQRVTWAVTAGSINSSGLYTAPTTSGVYEVTATSVANPAKKATAQVTVSSGPNNLELLVHTPLTSNGYVPEGETGNWWIDVRNLAANPEIRGAAEGVTVTLTLTTYYESREPRTDASCDPPPASIALGDIAHGATATQGFSISCTMPGEAPFDMTVVCVSATLRAADGSTAGGGRFVDCEKYRNWPA